MKISVSERQPPLVSGVALRFSLRDRRLYSAPAVNNLGAYAAQACWLATLRYS